jgi:sigma-B regulation protein RsbU (phosphoserine phosphatase)
LPKYISLKWKISLALIVVSTLIVAGYIVMAIRTFETDKISYLFDFFQLKVDSQSSQINKRFEKIIINSKSILAGIQTNTNHLSNLAEKHFNEIEDIRTLRIYEKSKSKLLFEVSKKGFIPPPIQPDLVFKKNINVEPILGNKSEFRIFFQLQGENQEELNIEIIAYLSNLLNANNGQGMMLLCNDKEVLETIGSTIESVSILKSIVSSARSENKNHSSLVKIGNAEYLSSVAHLDFQGFFIMYIESKETAFSALKLLTNRSLVFALFAFFILGILSLLTSGRLTRQISRLTLAAENIGRGDLDTKIDGSGNDEVGLLATTFSKMALDIKKLLIETKDKERMEHELKTAQYVQSHLFPVKVSYTMNKINIFGGYLTSTECGGDWWFYFISGDDIFIIIADATGHGTPAAMITAVSRSIFVQFEKKQASIEEMTSVWNEAIANCSGNKIFMTAIILQINTISGVYRGINACHEVPYLIKRTAEGDVSDFLQITNNSCLGEDRTHNKENWSTFTGKFNPGDRIMLYTDGLWDIKTPSGNKYSSRRFQKKLNELSNQSKSEQDLVQNLFKFVDDNQAGEILPDDIAAVVIKFDKGGE